VSYDDNGFYGHPDHIRANRITVAAFEAAADPARFPEAGEPWQPLKLYYTAVPRSRIVEFGRRMQAAGIETGFESDGDATPDPPIGTPDELVTTYVDVSAQVDSKHRALLAHATQMGADVFFAKLDPPLFRELFSTETFQLVKSLRPTPEREDDLFAGLR
jgi:mycothiol S-conjugate amidase